MKHLLVSFIFILVATPLSFVEASLRINEISWQGYLGDANNEWIELFNEGGESLVLDGWLLEASDGTPSINLSGVTVGGGDFVLLERTDDTTVPEVSGDIFYSGALSNEGESLILKNADGTILDSVDFSSGWEMSSDSADTLSFFNSGWGQGLATPKDANVSSSSNENNEENDEEDTVDQDDEENTEDVTGSTETAGKERNQVTYKERKATIQAETYAFPGVPFSITSHLRDLDGGEIRKGFYAWNMGDGTVYYKGRKEEFTHTYHYPGEYVVSLAYNPLTWGKEPEDIDPLIYDEHVVTVASQSLSLESFDQGAVTIKNNSKHPMNIEDWVITNNDSRFVVPQNTIIRAGKTVTFPRTITRLEHNPIFIINPSGEIVDYSSQESHTRDEGIVFGARTTQVDSGEDLELEPTSLSNEEVLLFEHEFESKESEREEKSGTVSPSLYSALFVFLLVLSLGVLWIMMSHKKKETRIDGYEIVESE